MDENGSSRADLFPYAPPGFREWASLSLPKGPVGHISDLLLTYRLVLTVKELREIAMERVKDAEALLLSKRYDGAMYICGYAVELALKARICKTLRWPDFPSEAKEFNKDQKYQFLKTHSLDLLLSYSAQEARVRTKFASEWSAVAGWNPESRYTPVTRASTGGGPRVVADEEVKAKLMIDSAKMLLKKL